MHRAMFLIFTLVALASCTYKAPNLKSPCVSTPSEDGVPNPCIRRPVNSIWLG